MSVLSAVAFLNGSNEQLDQRAPSPTSPTPGKPTTQAAIKELNRIRTGGGNGVASLLSKFGNEATPVRPPPSPRSKPAESPNSRPSNSPIPTTTTTTTATTTTHPTNNDPKPAPAPSPAKKTVAPNKRTSAQMVEEEIMTIYEDAIKKAEAAEKELVDLRNQITTYETDATKVRDYEIRVEYLAQKLEQVSEDRDVLEQELKMYRERQGHLDTPVSPVFPQRLSEIFSDRQRAEDEQNEEDENNEFMDGILDAYEDDEDESSSFGAQSQSRSDQQEQIEYLTEQLRAADEGTKFAVQHYLTELEQERLRGKAMEQVLKKQEELISTLEIKLASSAPSTPVRVAARPPRNASLASPTQENSNQTERALRAQVESQRVELEDKRTLLTQLLNEREDMLNKVNLGASRPGTSSFDLLAELARPGQRSSSVDGRNTPPPTAPPRDPLPPVPAVVSPSKSSARGSLSSFQEESAVSSVTSWSSSTDYYGRQETKKEGAEPNGFMALYSHYMEDDSFEVDDPYEHHLEALRRLEGPESPSKMAAH